MVEGGEEGEVGYVLDASAIGALLERLGERGLRYLEGAVTLDLALYELGNVLGLTFYDASYLYLAKSRDRRPATAWG